MTIESLPLLPTMGVGSYAAPSWLLLVRARMRAGEMGPDDIAEAFEDAVRIAVADQQDAGLDILSDGEFRRQRFVYEMYDRLAGIERVPPGRRLGVPGYDRAPSFHTAEPVTAPDGLGVTEEFRALKALAPDQVLKAALPGPLTFAGNIEPVGDYQADQLLDDLVRIIRRELVFLAEAGPAIIQLDEPGYTRSVHGLSMEEATAVINRTLEGIGAYTAVHVCFGNNAGRPFSDRSMARFFPAIQDLDCRQLVLEFANREMADIESLGTLAASHDIAAGVIDVKNFAPEDAEQVSRRIERVLEFVPAEKLSITADCGFSALPRWLARDKMRAMVAGTRKVREWL